MKKKEITIEDLARMVQSGFSDAKKQVDARFDQVDKRFEGVDIRLDNLENKVTKIDSRLDNLENKVNQIDRRLFSIEEDVAEIKIKQYGDLLKRINFIERKLGIAKS